MAPPVKCNPIFYPLLYLLSLLYGLVVRLRLMLYKLSIKKTAKLDCKVISVGNITVGGSGKTPFTIMLAKMLKSQGKSVCIISRGYKRKSTGVLIVSDKEKILVDVENGGDEPFLIARCLPGVPVIVASKRFGGGIKAIEKFNPDVVILDDGYQHIQLYRDLNIMLLDGREGFGNKKLLPFGILREPLSELKRAQIIFSKGDIEDSNKITPLKKEEVNIFNLNPVELYNFHNETLTIEDLLGKDAAMFCAIANPESFRNTLKSMDINIKEELFYKDHHWYDEDSLKELRNLAANNDIVITTEKDFVKLTDSLKECKNIYALKTECTIIKNGLKNLEDAVEKSLGI